MVVRDEMDVCVEFAVDLSWDTYPPFNPQQPPQTTLLLDQTLGETSSKCTTTARTRLLETSTWPSADLQLGRARARRTRFGRRHCFSMGDTVTGQEQLSRPRRRSRRTTWSGGAPSARLGAPAHINPLFINLPLHLMLLPLPMAAQMGQAAAARSIRWYLIPETLPTRRATNRGAHLIKPSDNLLPHLLTRLRTPHLAHVM